MIFSLVLYRQKMAAADVTVGPTLYLQKMAAAAAQP
jgi:hypothetical protein